MQGIEWSNWFTYDETSPSCLRWKVDRVSGRWANHVHVRAGDCAGSPSSSSYQQVKLNSKLWLCHRIIIEMHGARLLKDEFVDHIDGNRSNNVLANLRVVDRSTNARNAKMRADNLSGFTGVSLISNGQGSFYWSARCEDIGGGYSQKRYPVNTHGYDSAFNLACAWRANRIEELNQQGAGYSDRHGTELLFTD